MKFGADIHGPKKMNPNDPGGSLTLHPAPPAGYKFVFE